MVDHIVRLQPKIIEIARCICTHCKKVKLVSGCGYYILVNAVKSVLHIVEDVS